MKKNKSGGATVFMLVSIAILLAAVAVTLVFTMRSRRSEETGPASDSPSASAPFGAQKPGSEASAKPQSDAGAQVEPDWLADEKLLDELANEPWPPATAEGGAEEDPSGGQDEQPPDESSTPEPTPEPTAAFVNPFSDVKETDYFYEPLMWAAQNEIVSGDSFSPGAVCTRAQAVTFLWRQQGEPEPKLRVSPFSDVSQTDYFYRPVLWAFESGLISTPADGKFHSDDAVNRAQVLTFLYRLSDGSAAGLSNPYSNVSAADYYYEPALWAYDRGIVILDAGESSFDATSPCTRAQFITFLYRCFSEGGA